MRIQWPRIASLAPLKETIGRVTGDVKTQPEGPRRKLQGFDRISSPSMSRRAVGFVELSCSSSTGFAVPSRLQRGRHNHTDTDMSVESTAPYGGAIRRRRGFG